MVLFIDLEHKSFNTFTYKGAARFFSRLGCTLSWLKLRGFSQSLSRCRVTFSYATTASFHILSVS